MQGVVQTQNNNTDPPSPDKLIVLDIKQKINICIRKPKENHAVQHDSQEYQHTSNLSIIAEECQGGTRRHLGILLDPGVSLTHCTSCHSLTNPLGFAWILFSHEGSVLVTSKWFFFYIRWSCFSFFCLRLCEQMYF